MRTCLALVVAACLTTPATSATAQRVPALRAKIQQIASASPGRLGAAAELLETGERVIVGEGFRYPMQSVYKLPIAMAVLRLVDEGALRLEQLFDVRPSDFVTPAQHSPIRDEHPDGARLSLRELLRLTVAESDGSTSDVALRLAGGPRAVMAYLHGIGVRDVTVATTEKEIGRSSRAQFLNWATPAGCQTLLRALQSGPGLSDTSRALLVQFLVAATPGRDRIPGLLPTGTIVAHKTGTSGSVGGVTPATNDIGIITMPNGQHIAVAVLLTNARGSAAARDSVIARVAKAAFDAFR
jgi:beta-lactamase class A